MSAPADSSVRRQPARVRAESVQVYARIAGVLLVLSILGGAFGEMYVPGKLIVPTDAAATARNLVASESLHRAGFAAYLVEAVCDIALAFLFYVLLRPVHENIALLAAFFGLVSTATFAVAELFYFSSALVLRNADYLTTFSTDQRNTLALLSLKTYGLGAGIFMVFYGVASILRGYLIFRSGYLPRLLGVLLALGGLGFVTRNFLLVLTPQFASALFLLPMFLATLSLTVWLLWKGVDVRRWEEKASPQPLSVPR